MVQTRIVLPSAQAMYDAAVRWRDASLVGDRSLFAGTEMDALSAVRQLVEGFVDQPDTSSGTFISKLRSQLMDVDPDAVQMAAELLYVHFLISSSDAMRGESKREKVNQVVAFREQGTSRIPEELEHALFGGVANAGTAYNTYRWKMFGYLIRLVERFKSMGRNERQSAVKTLEAFRRITADIDAQSAWTQQFALEHLLFPDETPPVLSRDDRASIVAGLGPELGETNVEGVAAALEPNVEFGGRRGINFYQTPVRERWQGLKGKLRTYTEWAQRMLEREDFEQEEMNWKFVRAKEIRTASLAIIQGSEPEEQLKGIFRKADFIDFRVADGFMEWCAGKPDALRAGLAALHSEPSPAGIDAFLAHVPEDEFHTMGGAIERRVAVPLRR